MKRILIVNADDCNLTRGVTEAICNSHDYGILTSTTFLVNLPIEASAIRELKRRKGLGVGIHLNVTLGKPVGRPKNIRSLLSQEGLFKKVAVQREILPKAAELASEYENQILLFQKVFGRKPTHLDTHHQMHDHPLFWKVLVPIAAKYKLPLRRSQLCGRGQALATACPLPETTDYLFGNLSAVNYWRASALETILKNLPKGVSEIMCHPGKKDKALTAISSFTDGREAEWRLFRSPYYKRLAARSGITLSHFGMCYT